MSETARIWQLIGTFIPVYGLALTVILAATLKRGWRITALLLVPLIFLVLCMLFGDRISHDGNMLYVLLALLYFIGLCIYYPALMIIGIFIYLRKKEARRPLRFR